VRGDLHSFSYADPLQFTADSVLDNARGKFPDLPLEYVCNSDGIVVQGPLAGSMGPEPTLSAVSKDEIMDISLYGTEVVRMSLLRTTTAAALANHLARIGLINNDEDALCTRQHIALDYVRELPDVDLEVLPKSNLISKSVRYKGKGAVVSALPEVELMVILSFVRNIFVISADVAVGMVEIQSGDDLGLDLTFADANGDIEVRPE